MKELYEKGVATHLGPESCGVVREDLAEALTGVRAGQGIEPRKTLFQGADAVVPAEGNRSGGAIASRLYHPAGSETLACTETQRREPGDPVTRHGCDGAVARPGNPKGVRQW